MIKLLQDYRIPYKVVSNRWVNICCPYSYNHQGGDNKFFLGIDTKKHGCNCWSCGSLNIYDVVAELLHISKNEAITLVKSYGYGTEFFYNEKRENASKMVLFGDSKPKNMHVKYLEKRGYNWKYLQKKYGIKFVTEKVDKSVLPYSIMFPITLNYRVVSYQYRSVLDEPELRYKTATPEQSLVHNKDFIFGLDDWESNTCGIVEGIFDKFRMGKGVGTGFGSSLTNKQINWLAKRFKRVIFMFDATDSKAWKKSKEHVKELKSLGIMAERVRWDEDKDPDELGFEKCRMLKQQVGIV